MNYELFTLINTPAGSQPLMDAIMKTFSFYMPFLFAAMLVVLYFSGVHHHDSKTRREVFASGVFLIVSFLVSMLFGLFYYENRPFVDHPNQVHQLLSHTADSGFPSDHVVGTVAIALGLGYSRRWLGILFFILALVVSYSRVYVGHHYPGDVVGGFIIVWILNWLFNKYFRKGIQNLYMMADRIIFRQ